MNSKIFIVVLAAVGIALGVHNNALMPERVASHFNAQGIANGWMPKDALLWTNIGIYFFMAALFTLIPVQWMNFPNRSYWLAPERAAATEALMSASYSRMGAATIIFLILVMQMVYQANLTSSPSLGRGFMVWFVLFVGYTVWETVRILKKFSKT